MLFILRDYRKMLADPEYQPELQACISCADPLDLADIKDTRLLDPKYWDKSGTTRPGFRGSSTCRK